MREFYRETPDEKSPHARSVRQRTRARLESAFDDMKILHDNIRKDDLREVIDSKGQEYLLDCLTDFISLIAREIEPERFEQPFETALNRALVVRGYSGGSASVTIDINRSSNIDEILTKLAEDETLAYWEEQTLVRLDSDDLTESQMEKLSEYKPKLAALIEEV